MSAITAASDDKMHAEIERLRAENESLKQQLAQRVQPVQHEIIKIAAECARREPIAAMHDLIEATHIGHRQFSRAFDLTDAAILRVSARLKAIADSLSAAPARPEQPARWCPLVCPITGLPFFMWIEHHETGQMVPTYGGPYDSYTIPEKQDDGSYCREQYDHDRGGWLTDEVNDVGVQIVSDQAYVSDTDPTEHPTPASNPAPRPWPLETDKPAAQPCGERGYCGRMPFCDCGNDAGLPERDTGKPAEQQGVFRKFEVRRVDGSDKPGDKHHGCEYFVLDVNHDPCAGAALAAYATAVEATHPVLAADMRSRYQLQPAAQDCSAVGDGPNPYYAGNFTGESDELANLRRRLVAERDAALKQSAAQDERT